MPLFVHRDFLDFLHTWYLVLCKYISRKIFYAVGYNKFSVNFMTFILIVILRLTLIVFVLLCGYIDKMPQFCGQRLRAVIRTKRPQRTQLLAACISRGLISNAFFQRKGRRLLRLSVDEIGGRSSWSYNMRVLSLTSVTLRHASPERKRQACPGLNFLLCQCHPVILYGRNYTRGAMDQGLKCNNLSVYVFIFCHLLTLISIVKANGLQLWISMNCWRYGSTTQRG
jgi:hypothetical protein